MITSLLVLLATVETMIVIVIPSAQYWELLKSNIRLVSHFIFYPYLIFIIGNITDVLQFSSSWLPSTQPSPHRCLCP